MKSAKKIEQSRNRWLSLLRYVRRRFKVKFVNYGISSRNVNGWAIFTGKKSIYIKIEKSRRCRSYNLLSSILIHEFGHCKMYQIRGLRHTEKDAWNHGFRNVPRRLIPTNFHFYKKQCLATYGH